MSNNKIIFFIPTLLGGGAEKVFVNLANHFADRNKDVILVFSFDLGYIGELNKSIKKEYILKKRKFKNRGLNALHRILFSIIKLSSLLIKENPGFLFCTLDEANIIGWLCKLITFSKVKFIARQANILDPIKLNGFSNFFLKTAFRDADLIIANSPDTELSIKNFIKVEKKIRTIGNPVYHDNFYKLSKQLLKNNAPIDIFNERYILSVGSLTHQKDHETLIKSFRIIRQSQFIHLIILGEGVLLQQLKLLVENENLSEYIHFCGFVEKPFPYFFNADAFVLSSLYEGFGNVLVESLGAGTPIVSTDCSGGPNYILESGKYGLLVPIRDPEKMASSVSSILNNEVYFERSSLIRRAQDFSLNNIGEKYMSSIFN